MRTLPEVSRHFVAVEVEKDTFLTMQLSYKEEDHTGNVVFRRHGGDIEKVPETHR